MLGPLVAGAFLLQVASSVAANPRVQSMLDRAPSPPRGDVALTLLLSADTVRVGEQLDIVTAAWFPRELLTRLRRPASVSDPTVDGVYTAVQATVTGVGASRLIDGIWYDLYVAHEVVFPLTAGVLDVPGAALTFSVPAGRQYFSEERLYRRTTDPVRVVVLPVPSGPDPAGGPVGRGLGLRYELSPEAARAGEPIPVHLVLSGSGNVALWPVPVVAWPEATRGYADRTEETLRNSRGLLQGERRFAFNVIADSAGSLGLPEVRYPYYDLTARSWTEAVARPVVLPVLPARPASERRVPPPLLIGEPWGVKQNALPPWVPALFLLLPPLLAAGWRWNQIRPRPVAAATADPLDALAALVRSRVPEGRRGAPRAVVAALRETGVDPAVSSRMAEVYDEYSNRRFAPEERVDLAELRRRAGSLLGRLPRRLLRQIGLPLVVLLAVAASGAPAQVPAPDSLYRAQAYSTAAGAYARLAAASPTRAAVWHNLAAASYSAGQDGRAAAAWLTARRLAPRSSIIEAGWRRVAPRSADLIRAGRVSPLTPEEVLLLAGGLWLAGWVLLAVLPRRRWVLGVLSAASVIAVAGLTLRGHYRSPLAVVTRAAVLRDAPHGLAREAGRVEELRVVKVRDRRPGWRLIELRDAQPGWVPAGSLAEVGRLDSGA